jgi:hypothetical protein
MLQTKHYWPLRMFEENLAGNNDAALVLKVLMMMIVGFGGGRKVLVKGVDGTAKRLHNTARHNRCASSRPASLQVTSVTASF